MFVNNIQDITGWIIILASLIPVFILFFYFLVPLKLWWYRKNLTTTSTAYIIALTGTYSKTVKKAIKCKIIDINRTTKPHLVTISHEGTKHNEVIKNKKIVRTIPITKLFPVHLKNIKLE